VNDPEPSAPARRRPFQGLGTAIGKGLFVAGNAIGALSARLYSRARARSSAAYEDFQGRPEHVRYRAYALGTYAAIVAVTLAGQFYTSNALRAYVRIQHVDIPETVEVFVRNDSDQAWTNVKLQLNGIYGFERKIVPPREYIQIKVDAFAIFDSRGKVTKAPRNVRIEKLVVDTDQGRYDVELEK
jgi:hypothetical protein